MPACNKVEDIVINNLKRQHKQTQIQALIAQAMTNAMNSLITADTTTLHPKGYCISHQTCRALYQI